MPNIVWHEDFTQVIRLSVVREGIFGTWKKAYRDIAKERGSQRPRLTPDCDWVFAPDSA
jgi:hypothetical protein